MPSNEARNRIRLKLLGLFLVLAIVAGLANISWINAASAGTTAPVLTELTLSGAPVIKATDADNNPHTFNFWYEGASFTFDLNTLTLAGADQNGNPFNVSGMPVTWAVYSGPAALNSDGHTMTITGSTDGSSQPQKNLNPICVTASVYSVTSNTLKFEVLLPDLTEDVSCDSTDSMPVRVFYNGALDETVLVTSPMLEALNPSNTIYQYSYIDHASECKFYSGWGPTLPDIITNYTSLSSAQLSNMVTDTTGASKISFTGVDNYQAWWPCNIGQSSLDIQDLLDGPLYYYPDGTGTNIMNGGYENFSNDANTQVVPTTIAVLAMGDPLQHYYNLSGLDNQRSLRLYMGMKNTTDIEDNNSVKWVDEMDITMPLSDNPATGVTLSKSADTIAVGGSDQLTATIAPANGASQYITWNNVTWTSSNPSVATVDQTGKVTAVALGTANISVTASNLTATCAVTVQAASPGTVSVTGVTLNKNSDTITAGQTDQLTATVSPSNATNKTLTWTSSDNSVATVDQTAGVTGSVYGNAPGAATITVTTADGGSTATCAVTVQANSPGGASGSPVLTTLNLGGTFDESLSYSGASFTYDLNSLVLTGYDQNKKTFDISGLPVTWTVDKSSIASLDSDGYTITIMGDGTINVTATVDKITSNTDSLTVGIGVPTTSMVINVSYDGLVFQTVKVTASMINALNPSNTIYQYSCIDHASRCKFYSGLGASLKEIISNYTSVTDMDDITYLKFTGSDGYQAWWPCNIGQSSLDIQDLLDGPLYYYPDGTGTNSMNGGYVSFTDDGNKQVVPTIIATEGMGDPLQHFYNVSGLDSTRCLRLYFGMLNAGDIEDNNSVKWVKEIDITTSVQPSSIVSTGGTGEIIPAVGGTISSGNDVSISIPPGALSGTSGATVAIQKVTDPPTAPSGFDLITSVFEFTVDGKAQYQFIQPVTLSFSFDPTALTPGETPVICYYDDSSSQWVKVGGAVTGSSITASVDHFTKFAVMVEQAATPPVPAPAVFTDVPVSYWANMQIDDLSTAGYVYGYPDHTFRPDNTVTRAEFIAILAKVLKLPAIDPAAPDFDDVSPGDWCYQTVESAVYAGLIKGDGRAFHPGRPITREEMSVIMVKAMAEQDEAVRSSNEQTAFTDDAAISPWARGCIAVAVRGGLLRGYPDDNSFRPRGSATRAEACAMIYKFLKQFPKASQQEATALSAEG